MPEQSRHAAQAAIKALTEMVAPAVDAADPLATDQLRLVISWLQFDALRRGCEPDFARARLALRIAQARSVLALLQEAQAPEASVVALALAVAADAQSADVEDVALRDTAGMDLDASVCAAVLTAQDRGHGHAARLSDVILDHARRDLLLHRAWFMPLGFEARPQEIPDIGELLRAHATA